MKKRFTFLAIILLTSIFGFAQNDQSPFNIFTKIVLGAETKLNPGISSPPNSFLQDRNNSGILNTTKHRLDSIIFDYSDASFGKEIHTYDSHGNCISSIEYSKASGATIWNNDYKTEKSYDIFGNIIQSINYSWLNTENRWRASVKYKYIYDGQGMGISKMLYIWNDDIQEWNLVWKEYQKFDLSGNIESVFYYNWQSDAKEWVKNIKYTYTYNAMNLLTSISKYSWLNESNTWEQVGDRYNNYSADNKLINSIYSIWNDNIATKQDKTDYTYDENGNKGLIISYTWSVETNQWIEETKNEFTYDDLGNTNQFIAYNWSADSTWIIEGKFELLCSNDIMIDEVLWPYEEDDMFQIISMPISFSLQSLDNDEWVDDSEGVLYYSEFEYDYIDEKDSNDAQIFPNPAINIMSVQFPDTYKEADFQLYDLQGRMIMKREIQNKENINIENLLSGVYIYSISFDGKTERGKLIKR